MSEESYGLAQELIEFSKSKKTALENSIKKLDEEIDKVYNDSYVNFYLQMVNDGSKSNPIINWRNYSQKVTRETSEYSEARRQAQNRAIDKFPDPTPEERESRVHADAPTTQQRIIHRHTKAKSIRQSLESSTEQRRQQAVYDYFRQ